MIEIIVTDKQGVVARAEAETFTAARYAADTLKREARQAWPYQGYDRTLEAGFYVDGMRISRAAPCGCVALVDETGIPCAEHHPDA